MGEKVDTSRYNNRGDSVGFFNRKKKEKKGDKKLDKSLDIPPPPPSSTSASTPPMHDDLFKKEGESLDTPPLPSPRPLDSPMHDNLPPFGLKQEQPTIPKKESFGFEDKFPKFPKEESHVEIPSFPSLQEKPKFPPTQPAKTEHKEMPSFPPLQEKPKFQPTQPEKTEHKEMPKFPPLQEKPKFQPTQPEKTEHKEMPSFPSLHEKPKQIFKSDHKETLLHEKHLEPPSLFSKDIEDHAFRHEKRVFEKRRTMGHDMISKGPLHIRLDKYKETLLGVNVIKSDFEKADGLLSNLIKSKGDKDKEFSKWRNTMTDIQNKLIFIEKTLFKG
jgi:hypothetical protein